MIKRILLLALVSFPSLSEGAPDVESGAQKNLGETLIRVDEKVDDTPLEPSVTTGKKVEQDLGHYSPQMLVPRFGFGIALPEIKDSSGFIGLLYGFESESFAPWEVGFDFLIKDLFQVQVGKRWIYFPKDSVRPFVKASLNWAPQPSLGLGNIVDWNRFQARAGVGLDDLGTLRSRIRWELEVAFSPLNTMFLVSVGFPILL